MQTADSKLTQVFKQSHYAEVKVCFGPYRFSDADALEFLYSLSERLLQCFLSGPQSRQHVLLSGLGAV